MTKEDAIAKFGVEAVEFARQMYETDFGKVLFVEDCEYEEDSPLNDQDELLGYLIRATYRNKV